MTSNQLKARELAQKESQFERSHHETKRSNRAQEAIGRTQAAASVAKAITSPFKIKLNHIDWYKHSATQLEAVAKLPYTKVKGAITYTETLEGDNEMTNKGIMLINYVDTLPVIGGHQGTISSPVNIISQNLFSKLRSKVSGSITFEAADYMMYIMSVGSYYSFWAYLCRLYNILNSDMFKDSLYLRSQLIQEMGYDFNQLDVGKLLLLTKINEFGSVLANFAIPNDLDYFKRKLWLSMNIFCDHKETKYGSLYMMNPTQTFRYTEGSLSAVPLGGHTASTRWGLYALVEVIDTIINSMTANESWIDMSGQTKRAYEGEYFTFPTLEINSTLNIVYDEDVLRQIQSCDISIRPLTLDINQVTDANSNDYGAIYQGVRADGLDFSVTDGFRYGNEGIIVNNQPIRHCLFSNEDSISYEDVARQTRLKSRHTVGFASGKQSVHYECVSTELVIGIAVLNTSGNVLRFEQLTNASHAWADLTNYFSSGVPTVPASIQLAIEAVKQTYHYCPLLFASRYHKEGSNTPEADNLYYYIPCVNDTVITACDNPTLDAINRVCVSSMLGLYDNLGK